MSEKQHKIDKFANYQNGIVRTSPALDRHVFVPSQSRSQGPRSFWSATGIGTYKVPVGRHYRNHIWSTYLSVAPFRWTKQRRLWKRDWFLPFSSPEPVVSWWSGRENHKLSRVALGTRMGSFQPRSQSSLAISDVTSLLPSPVKLVGEIRYRARFQASSGHSDSANRPGYEAEFLLKSVDLNVDLWFWRNAHDQYTNPLARPLLIALQVVRINIVWISFTRMYGK